MFVSLRHFVVVALLLLPQGVSAREAAAAIVWRTMDVELATPESNRELRFRRIGIEYWEAVASGLQMGFAFGYAENEAASEGTAGLRPVGEVAGRFGALGLRFQAPLSEALSLEGGAEYLLQRDVHDAENFSFETRSWETRAEVAAVTRYRNVIAGLGASWRDINFRETRETTTETTRRSGNTDHGGGFASVGLHTGDGGSVVFRYDAGAEQGWSLRFERNF